MQSDTLDRPSKGQGMEPTIPELCELAATGLVAMFDAEKQVFCHTYMQTGTGMIRQGVSHRYTMMTLLGLHRYERAGKPSPVAISPVLDALLQDTSWIAGAGDLGLLLWTCAELAPARVPETYERVRAPEALTQFIDGRQGRTMEVAWYLTGLVACCESGHTDLPGLAGQITAARKIVERNCGDSGAYGHLHQSGPLKSYVRQRIGSFADQVYPTIALSRLSQVLNDHEARARAVRTATLMCALQGPQGEWSWHYDAATGRVVSRYPVYSVHQHAMAPMMLFAAGEAAGCDFSEALYKGVSWISGNNELHRDFIEPSLGLIWRCIYLERKDAYTDAALRFLQLRRGASNRRLNVRYECRPYELGWLLYAFAGR
jgi:hypothetical protein